MSSPALKSRTAPTAVPTPTTEVVTPALAAQWLHERPFPNRTLSPGAVAAYARDMLAGKWAVNNDAICFAADGGLLNGQHRLRAIVLAGETNPDIAIRTLVLRNLPPQAQESMDQGRIRRAGDVLSLRGFTKTNVLAATAVALLSIKHPSAGLGERYTTAEKVTLIERHPHIVESTALTAEGTHGPRARGINGSLAAALHYIGKHLLHKPETADAFMGVLKTGIPTYAGDPVHLLREKILTRIRANTVMSRTALHYSAIRAWNLFARGEGLTKFMAPRQTPILVDDLDTDLI